MSITSQAEYELDKAGWKGSERFVMLDLLHRFLKEWDSGGAVAAVAPVFQRLLAGKPLSPLTGDDDEWNEVGDGVFQNRRCSTVFKQDGRAYDIDVQGRPTITFPYNPERADIPMPIMEI